MALEAMTMGGDSNESPTLGTILSRTLDMTVASLFAQTPR